MYFEGARLQGAADSVVVAVAPMAALDPAIRELRREGDATTLSVRREEEVEGDCSGANGRGGGSRGGVASEEEKKESRNFFMEGDNGCGKKKMNEG